MFAITVSDTGRKKLIEQNEVDRFKIMVGNFNTLLSASIRTSRHKLVRVTSSIKAPT